MVWELVGLDVRRGACSDLALNLHLLPPVLALSSFVVVSHRQTLLWGIAVAMPETGRKRIDEKPLLKGVFVIGRFDERECVRGSYGHRYGRRTLDGES